MSGSSSDWSHSQFREDRSPLGSIAESLLSSISEIMKSVICIQAEKEIFTDIGCYFYRASAIFMELRINWSTPTNTTEILQSLSKKLELAKSFTVRNASASLLLELSKCNSSIYKIGAVAGGILMLITVKYKQSSDAFASETADKILKNLEILPENIKLMAENGYWEPLLAQLIEGSEETKMVMSSYLGEIVLGPDSMKIVAETASPSLIQMVQSENSLIRNSAFKALKQISCYHPNAGILIEAGIMQIMVEEMFTTTIHNEPMNSRTEAAMILANILESGLELENLPVSTQGHTMASDYIVYNIIYRIKSTSPDDLNINFIRILLCLIKFPKASATIVSIVKETEASYNLIELINTMNEELGVASIKLLMALSSFMGHTLSDRLCRTQGQPGSLIKNPSEITRITEIHAVSANFLSKLPHQNLTLNLALINSSTILCPIHGGVCSSQETFCLLDAEAVERLLACLDHENVEVIEAALSALSSLLDEKVNVDNSVSLLSEKHAISYLLNAVKEHKEEGVWQKAFWMIERFLMKGGDVSVSNISQDRLFPATLVSALHNGDDYTKEMAEKILRHLNKMPNVSNTMSFNM